MAFDFYQKLRDEDGEIDEAAASDYVDELSSLFAESPEGEALAEGGGEPGHHLDLFLDYALRYTGASPAEMTPADVREALFVMAEKVTARPEDLDEAIPELEAFCDFVVRAFGLTKAATWKREIERNAAAFRQAVRDSSHWGMAKSMMMEGLARGYDLSTQKGLDEWMTVLQAEQIARLEAERARSEGKPPGPLGGLLNMLRGRQAEPADEVPPARPLWLGPMGDFPEELGERPPGPGGAEARKKKARRKQARASRRRNRR